MRVEPSTSVDTIEKAYDRWCAEKSIEYKAKDLIRSWTAYVEETKGYY